MAEHDDPVFEALARNTNHSRKSSFAGVQEKPQVSSTEFQSALDGLDFGEEMAAGEVAESVAPAADSAVETVDFSSEPPPEAEPAACPPTEVMEAVQPPPPPEAGVGFLARLWRTLFGWMRG